MPYSVRKCRAKGGGWDVYKKHGTKWRKVAHSKTKGNAQTFVRIAEESTGKYKSPKRKTVTRKRKTTRRKLPPRSKVTGRFLKRKSAARKRKR